MSDESENAPQPRETPRVDIDALRGPLARTALRVRLQRAADAGSLFLLVGLGLAGLVVALTKTAALPEADAWPYLIAAAALPALAAFGGLARRVSPLLAAKLLDRAHDLNDRVGNAVSFAAEPDRTAFMDAAIEDARQHASALRPARAMPLRAPMELAIALGLAVGVGGLAILEVPRTWEERIVHGGIVPVFVHADELEAYESHLRELLADPETDERVRAAAEDFNRIVEDLADERLDREESLRRIADLERRLAEARPADQELLADALRELGEDLRRSALADELSAALRDADADRAEDEMRQLAAQLRQDPRRQDLESLRRALERAAERRAEDRSQQIEQAEEEIERLLQRQREQQREASPQEQRLLQRRRRELDQLRREHQEAQERQRQLDRLRRELSQSAQSLQQRDQQRAADDLDRGAEDLNRMARQQMSQEEMQQLQQQLEQLREAIRRAQQRQAQNGQQGQQGQQQQQGRGQRGQGQMDRFVLRARGQGDGEGTPIQMPGQGGQQGQAGQGGQGQGQQGEQGQGGQQQQTLTLGGDGPSNAILEVPGMGQAQQQQGGQGDGPQLPGPGAGTGHDETLLDEASRLAGDRRTVRVEGDQSEGPSRSEVIRSSGQRGFASRSYRDTYTDYRGHAEEVLERDEVPPGRRFFVRRYFQLIRPRE